MTESAASHLLFCTKLAKLQKCFSVVNGRCHLKDLGSAALRCHRIQEAKSNRDSMILFRPTHTRYVQNWLTRCPISSILPHYITYLTSSPPICPKYLENIKHVRPISKAFSDGKRQYAYQHLFPSQEKISC